ncbi:MAG: hypothetical protein DCC67_02715 [Planctomycetota bacterium]|nr:MAG: hypothetical protein DCC67_02715 [Planctomycetota bacterium]
MFSYCVTALAIAVPAGHPAIVGAATPDAAGVELFETHVRPLLLAACGPCHGEEEQWSELRVDSRDALLRGGERGPAVVPGEPEQSLLLQAVRRTDDLEMPPDDPLNDQQIAALEQWIARGAPWPEEAGPRFAEATASQNHWAFKPVGEPPLPLPANISWCRTPVDRFILAELERHRLAPSPPADRRTLIRRATYDLTGLPPAADEVDAFVQDADPAAYEKLVDRLLASPQYGEHWARHWLDVARYSDTKGYVYAREERFFVHAYPYRDWVVRAFNEDLPYDRFVLLQLAADQAAPDDRQAQAAMGFLTLGRRFLGVTHDIIDDRIDVVSRGLLGLTVACARCHDHKYDPIPTEDYYALYGVFQNCTERLVQVAPGQEQAEGYAAFAEELRKRQAALHTGLAAARAEAADLARSRVGKYLQAQLEPEKYPEENFDQVFTKNDILPAFVRRWQNYLEQAAQSRDAIFEPWRRFRALPAAEFATRAAVVAREIAGDQNDGVHPLVAQAFSKPPVSMAEVAQRYGELFATIDKQWQDFKAAAPESADRLPDDSAEALRQVLYGPDSPCVPPDEPILSIERYFDTGTIDAMWKLQGELDRWVINSPLAPRYAVTLVDRPTIQEPRVFRRGNPMNRGATTPRQFLKALAGDERRPFVHGSGRLELARAIVAPDNPLTARVWVNRVWRHHFGAGLVRTPSDFGLRAEPPSHPALLDWLASRFMKEGWRTKDLHRLIMLSAAYQQRAADDGDELSELARRADPDNRLLWRMNRRRLSFEEWRDTLLAASGELDLTLGGRPAELFKAGVENRRRTLYGLVDRQFLDGAMRMFDFANPDLHTPQRSETIVAQQSLFALNHPFVAGRARALAERLCAHEPGDAAQRVERLYAWLFQRPPTPSQRQAALDFVAAASDAALAEPPDRRQHPWEQLAQVLLLTNEMMFID